MRVFNQPAYTLLNRPYSETSYIVEVFSRDYGRLGLMAKGARRIKSKLKGALQPFQPVLVSWSGKGEVPTLTSVEIDQGSFDLFQHDLRGDGLVCGFYCNELLVNLLHRHDPHQSLFDAYHKTVLALYDAYSADNKKHAMAEILRTFEQSLIKESGYEVSFLNEADGQTLIEDNAHYRFQLGYGFVRVAKPTSHSMSGQVIKSLHGVDKAGIDDAIGTQAKRLMRDVLAQTLGNKKVISRDLFFPHHTSN